GVTVPKSVRSNRSAFFLSSRRRHMMFSRDWSSDVCSSDLSSWPVSSLRVGNPIRSYVVFVVGAGSGDADPCVVQFVHAPKLTRRSEERRVGKEGGGRGAPYR